MGAKLGRPGLAVPTFSTEGGGVAYVARLLRAALSDLTGREPWSIELTRSARPMNRKDVAAFGFRLFGGTIGNSADWIFFAHPGLSRAQRAIPRRVRLPYAVQLHGTEAWEGELARSVWDADLRI